MGLGAKIYAPKDAFRERRFPDEKVLGCPECDGKMRLKQGSGGWFYGCDGWPRCSGTHSAHQKTGAPMGIPGDKRTKWWRMRAHEAFDPVWQSGKIKRQACYKDTRHFLKLKKHECHIGRFDVKLCKRSIQFSNSVRPLYGLPLFKAPEEQVVVDQRPCGG